MVRAVGLAARCRRRNRGRHNAQPIRRQPFRGARAVRPGQVAAPEEAHIDPAQPFNVPDDVILMRAFEAAFEEELHVPPPVDVANVHARRRIHIPLYLRVREGKQYVWSHRVADTIYGHLCFGNFCDGTAQIELNDLDVFISLTPHNEDLCFEDENALIISRFLDDIKDTLNQNWYVLRALYDTKAQVHPQAAAMISYVSLQKSMLRWRQRRFPPMPANLEEFAASLQGARLEFSNGFCTAETVVDEEFRSHLLIYNLNQLQNEFANVRTWFMEATYAGTPDVDGAKQIFNIVGLIQSHLLLGCCAVMTSRTAAAYRACIARFQRLVPNINVTLILSNYEVELRTACKHVFPAAYIAACKVQFERAIYQQLKDLGMENRLRDDEEVQQCLGRILALACLPANEIEAAYFEMLHTLSERCRGILHRFLNYFERTWLRLVQPDGFSIFGLVNRSTNAVDLLNARFKRILSMDPAAYDFISRLLVIMDETVIDMGRLRHRRKVRRAPNYTKGCTVDLVRAWRLYSQRLLSRDQLIGIVISLQTDYRRILNQLVHVEDELRERHAQDFHNFNDGMDDPEFEEPLVNQLGLAQAERDLQRIAELPNARGAERVADIIHVHERLHAPIAVREERDIWDMIMMRRRDMDVNARQDQGQPIDIGEDNENENLCAVCLTNLIDHVLLPCGHMQFCGGCARQLYNRPVNERKCPVCRAEIFAYFRVFA